MDGTSPSVGSRLSPVFGDWPCHQATAPGLSADEIDGLLSESDYSKLDELERTLTSFDSLLTRSNNELEKRTVRQSERAAEGFVEYIR
jgi:hypothetical protein